MARRSNQNSIRSSPSIPSNRSKSDGAGPGVRRTVMYGAFNLGELDREFRCSSFFPCWSRLFELCCLSCFFNARVESATQVIRCAKRRSWMKQKKRGGK